MEEYILNPMYDWHTRVTWAGMLVSIGGFGGIAALLAWRQETAWLWVPVAIAGIAIAVWGLFWMTSWSPPSAFRVGPDALTLRFGRGRRAKSLNVGWERVIRVTPPHGSRKLYRLFIALPTDPPPVQSVSLAPKNDTVFVAKNERALDVRPSVWTSIEPHVSSQARALPSIGSGLPSSR